MAEKIIESARARVLEITEEKKRTAVEPLAEDEEVNASSDETNPPTNTEEDPAS